MRLRAGRRLHEGTEVADIRGASVAAGVVLVWGVTFSLVKSALTATTPLMFNLVRMTLAFAVLAAVNWPSLRGVTRTDLKLGAAAGLFLGLGYQFQTTGLKFTTASKAAFLTGLVVVIVPLLSAIPGVALPGSLRPTFDTYAGAALAFAGLVLLTTPPGAGYGAVFGDWAGGVALPGVRGGVCGASADAGAGGAGVSARRLATLQIGFAAVVLLVTLPLGGRPYFHGTVMLWIALGGDGGAGDGGCVYDPELGAAASAGIAYRADIHAGAGVCVADFPAFLWRAAGAAGVGGSGVDPGGNPAGGAAANLAGQESTPTYRGRVIWKMHTEDGSETQYGPRATQGVDAATFPRRLRLSGWRTKCASGGGRSTL